jgi:hypothetical protein
LLPSPDFSGGVPGDGDKRGALFVPQRPERAGDHVLGRRSMDIAHSARKGGTHTVLDSTRLALNVVGECAKQPAEAVVFADRL